MKNTVLVVDDSPETLGMLNLALEQAGMVTLVALEGKQAISIANNMQPDIILLDAMMPGMDGFEVCQEIKKTPELTSIPVIFMTGLSDTEHVVKGFEAGGVDYVTKPINTAELIARMRVHLANAQLTISTKSALDSTGQFIFAVSNNGHILWSTPQVNQFLERATNQNENTTNTQLWLNNTLSPTLKAWLNHTPTTGTNLTIDAPHHTIRTVFLGKTDNDEYLLRLLDADTAQEAALLQRMLDLTAREAEVLIWMTNAKTNREIAQILGASPRTINKHTENIYNKLCVENRTAAAAKALQLLNR